jgi:hypothetical protein
MFVLNQFIENFNGKSKFFCISFYSLTAVIAILLVEVFIFNYTLFENIDYLSRISNDITVLAL